MLIKLWGRHWVDPREVVSIAVSINCPGPEPGQLAIVTVLKNGKEFSGYIPADDATLELDKLAGLVNEALVKGDDNHG